MIKEGLEIVLPQVAELNAAATVKVKPGPVVVLAALFCAGPSAVFGGHSLVDRSTVSDSETAACLRDVSTPTPTALLLAVVEMPSVNAPGFSARASALTDRAPYGDDSQSAEYVADFDRHCADFTTGRRGGR